MRKIKYILIFLILIVFTGCGRKEKETEKSIRMAVEFVAHAAAPHITRAKAWFKKEGLNIVSYDNYITGMALAAALTRGDIDAAYICLIPAISAYKNGGVKIKVVCGTHKYGYGLVVNPQKVKTVKDLLKEQIKVACSREGSPLDVLMNKMIEKYHLDGEKLRNKVLRMPPPKALILLKTGQIDAAFCCEQFPSMAVQAGFKELLSAQDLWKNMQGSVLVVKDELIKKHPEIVQKLVDITKKGIEYIYKHPDESSEIVADALTVAGKTVYPIKVSKIAGKLTITPSCIKRALFSQMICSPDIDIKMVQEEIDYMYKLGYIKEKFDANEIVDLRFLK